MNPLRVISCTLMLLALALSLLTAPVDADEKLRNGTPFTGVLPAPDGVSPEARSKQDSYVVRILDGRTGKPIQGAVVRRYPEMIQDYWIRHDFLLAQGQADERGYARISAEGYDGDSHWVADAKGFGPRHDYGVSAPEVVYLFPGVDVGGRLLDSVGQPVVDGRVDYFLGCGHGPTMRSARTNAQGHFTLRRINPYDGQLWIEGAGIQANYHDVESLYQYGDRLHDIIAAPGVTAIGRVIDAAGVPIQGVVVRSLQCHRGPATMTDVDGGFALHSVEPGNELYFHHPASLRKSGAGVPNSSDHGRTWRDGVPCTYVLDQLRLHPPPIASGKLVVQANTPSAPNEPDAREPSNEIGFDAISLTTGSVFEGYAERSPASVTLPPGRWRLAPIPDAGLARYTFTPFDVDVVAAQTTQATIVYREQPRLVLTGVPKRFELLEVCVPGVSSSYDKDDDAPAPHVPATGPVAICVRANEHAPTQCFRAGPLEAGNVRRVAIQLPKPTRIEVVGLPSERDVISLYRSGNPVAQDLREVSVRDDGTRIFDTYATGPLELRLQRGEQQVSRVLDVPSGGGTLAVEFALSFPPQREVMLDVRDASGNTPSNAQFLLGDQWNHDVELKTSELVQGLVLRVGQWGRVERPGWRTLYVRPTDVSSAKAGTLPLRWGTSVLDLRIEYDGGLIDSPSTVWVDDTAYSAPAGQLTLRGLEPGTHDAIVVPYEPGATPRDDDSPPEVTGRRLEVTLPRNATHIVRVPAWQDD